MTEDAAVFGGLNNMVEGLANTYALYSPKMIAVSTTCMAEVIGDDLNSFIIKSKEKESVPADFPVPFAHTPAFVGSHVDGYDNMQKGILSNFWKDAPRTAGEGLNIIPGFDGYCVGNVREMKRMLGLMGVEATVLGDASDVYDTPLGRRVPHVCGRHHAGGDQGGPEREGHPLAAGILHPQDARLLRGSGPGRPRRSTIRWASRPPTSS